MSKKIGQAFSVFFGIIMSFAVLGDGPLLFGTELTRTVDALTESNINHLVFFVEDTDPSPQTTDTDQIWIVQVNNVGNASYLMVFRQDDGVMTAYSGLDMPLLSFMALSDISMSDSCESNPVCFSGSSSTTTSI